MLSPEQTAQLLARLDVIPYFPRDEEARAEIGLTLGRKLSPDRLDDFIRAAAESFDEYPGLKTLAVLAEPSREDPHAAKPWESPANCDACKNTGWRYISADRVTRCACQGVAA